MGRKLKNGMILKVLLLVSLLIILSSFVAARTFDKDAKYSKDDINYIFKEGFSLKNFEIKDGGIVVDDMKFGFVLEGGTLDVNFYGDGTLGLKTSVPQKIKFSIYDNGIQQYINDGESIFIDSYDIGTSEVVFAYEPSEEKDENIIDIVKESTPIERKAWGDKKLFEIEYKTSKDENGIISGEYISLNNLSVLIFGIVLFLILMFWWFT